MDKTGCEGLEKRIKELEQSEKTLRAILSATPTGIGVVENRVMKWHNRAMSEMLGYASEELHGKNARMLYATDEEFSLVGKAIASLGPDNKTSAIETRWVRKDGSIFDCLIRYALLDPESTEDAVVAIVEDITDRKRAEKALRQSEERYRSLVENTLDGYFISEIPSFRILFVNQRACDLFGYTMEEALNLSLWDTIVPEDHTLIQERLKKRMEKERLEQESTFYMGKRKDGSTFRAEVASSIVMFQEQPALQGIIKDVTEQKRLEQQLQQAQKMEAIGTLAGGVAHDFNNLLQAILGYTQILTMGKHENDPELMKLEQIEKSAMRASELTQQLLAFSRKVESKLRPVDLNLEVKQVQKLLKRTIPKMISIELHLQEDLQVVNADPAQVEQVMMNLAVNARDAMPEGGKLIIETENVLFDEQYCKTHPGAVPGQYVCLSITDTGHGMDQATVDHIFEPFYTTKEVGKGTGLGLSMVYGIVKSHRGYIMCYSEPGEGTTFKIYLPAVESESREQKAEPEKEAEIKGGEETILLVDDEELLRDIGKEILEEFGYTVCTASDGETALKQYSEKKDEISLVILDLMMPVMGGKQCLEQILAMDPDAKVVIASGYSVNGPTRTTLEAGAMGFIKKPFELKQMLKVVREVLDQGKP
ncbi:MAG: PAS domain S-box protein [Deltaproteobacteria bacterium]|nr:PAS domain S-box protein [Deltaproteobacteria bacterium]